MNWLHRRLCTSRPWRSWVASDLLPWALSDVSLGDDVLEIGPGPGAATGLLLPNVRHLTCVEVDRALADKLARGFAARNISVRCEDATTLSAPDGAFDTVLCLMVLHHVSPEARQDRLFAEAARVLRTGGCFVMVDATAGPVMSVLHVGDTLLPIDPRTIKSRLVRAGFDSVEVDARTHAFRVRARRSSTRDMPQM